MPRLIFVNRFFFPDHSATSQMLSDLAFYLAATGNDVHVITSRLSYDDPQAVLPEWENIHGVSVHRMATTRFGRMQLLGRTLDYLSFFTSLHTALAQLARPGDIIIAKTDPPLLSIVAASVARRKRAHLINWLQDLYPDIAIQLGVPYIKGPVAASLRFLRNISLRRAAMNVAVGEKMAELVRRAGVPASAVCVIPNWANDEELVPVARTDNPLRGAWQLANKFIVGYSGNLGRAHEFDTILEAAEQLRNNTNIVFVFIGGGHFFEELARRVAERALSSSFRFVPYQKRSQLKNSLTLPDVHLLSLRRNVEGLVVPSKFYGIAAAGRPILAVISTDGEFAPLLKQHECGLVIEPGHGPALAQAIIALSNDPDRCAAMGARARAMLDARFSKAHAFERWLAVFDNLRG